MAGSSIVFNPLAKAVAPASDLKPLNNSQLKSPLLDLCDTEKAYVSIMNIITGFSLLSGPASAVEANIAIVPTVSIVGSISAIGVLGGIAGAYRANKQIKAEQEKITRLNKELFLMFNIAADKYKEWKEVFSADSKSSGHLKVNSEKSDKLEKEYYSLLKQMQISISSSSAKVQHYKLDAGNENETNLEKHNYTSDVYKMGHMVQQYVKHRESNEGVGEKTLWELLKKNNIHKSEGCLQDFFLNYNNEAQAREFFHGKRKNDKDKYKKDVQKIESLLATLVKENQILNQEEYSNSMRVFVDLLKDLYDVASVITKKTLLNAASSARVSVAVMFYLEPLTAAYKTITNNIKSGAIHKGTLDTIWNKGLLPLIEEVEYNIRFIYTPETKVIPEQSSAIFGENGTFRQFWRKLPSTPYVHHGESIPVNLDQSIYRAGDKPSYTSMGVFGVGVATGLFTTGKGLYIAAVALGAVALSSTGIGLIVAAVAVSLTLLGMYCYYRSQKAQNNRDILLEKLKESRLLMLAATKPANASPVSSPETSPVESNSTQHGRFFEAAPTNPPSAAHDATSMSLGLAADSKS